MKKLKLLVGVILSSFALSSCSFFSMFTPNNSNNDNSNGGGQNSNGGQTHDVSELLDDAKQFELFYNEDKTVVEAFATSADLAVSKINKAEAIRYNSSFNNSSVAVKGNLVVNSYDEDSEDNIKPQTFSADLALKNASMNSESAVVNAYSEELANIFAYEDVTNINGNVSGNYEIKNVGSSFEESAKTAGLKTKGNFNYTLTNGAIHATLQDKEAFLDFSDTHLISFANTILADTNVIDFKKALNSEDTVTVEKLLEQYNYSSKIRTGALDDEFDSLKESAEDYIEDEVLDGEEEAEFNFEDGIMPFGKEEIVNFFDHLLSDEMSEMRPVIQDFIKYLNLKTYVYPAKDELAYSVSISIPNLNSLEALFNLFTSNFIVADEGEELEYEAITFNEALGRVGVTIQNFKTEMVIALRKDGGLLYSANLQLDAVADSKKATSIILAEEDESGLASYSGELHLNLNGESSVTFPTAQDVLSHKLSEQQKATYLHRCLNHNFNYIKEEIDSCHTHYEEICEDCGYVSYSGVSENHSYNYSYNASTGVQAVCAKCGEVVKYDTSTYTMNGSDGSPVNFKVNNQGRYFVFTPRESGPYTFVAKGDSYLYGHLLDSKFSSSNFGYNSSRKSVIISGSLEAGQTYYLYIAPDTSREVEYNCTLSCYFDTCVENVHVGSTETRETAIDSCHTKVSYICSKCGEEKYSYTMENHTVDYNNPIVEEIDSCHTRHTYKCSVCGEVIMTENAENHDIDYENPVITRINECETKYEYYCKKCGELYDSYIDDNHEYKQSIETINESEFHIVYTCEKCHNSYYYQGYTLNDSCSFKIGDETIFFAFTPKQSGTYSFSSSSRDYIDTYGTLLDSNLEELDYNDDGAGNGNFLINYQLEANKTYYLAVRLYSPSVNKVDCTVTVSRA